jgi:Archaeal/vacuolar-type H+-ATPase subunit D
LVIDLEHLRREIAEGFVEVAGNFKIAVAKSGIDRIENIAELTPKTAKVELINRGTHMGFEVNNYVTYPTYSIATEAAELDVALVKMRELLTKLIEFAEKRDTFSTLFSTG